MSVIVVQCIAKLELGGAQKRVLELMEELKDEGILITGEGGELYDKVREKFGVRHIVLPTLKRKVNPINDIVSLFKLRKELIKLYDKYDKVILHTHGSKAGVLGRIASGTLPFVYSIHTVHGFAINPYIKAFRRFVYLNAERISALFGDVIITQAHSHIDRLKEWGIGMRNKIICIPNSIKCSDFGFFSERKRRNKIVVGTIANFKPQKNPIIWALVAKEVARKYPEAEFIYVGDGYLKDKVKALTINYKRIKFWGWRDDISETLRKIDIFFLPSRWEGLPRTVLEAMASGIPVIASSVDGTVEAVLNNETGYLLSPDDVEGYVEKLEELITDEKKRKTMGKKGRERVEKYYSFKDMIKETMRVYKSFGLK